jgi:hypothetical protein
LEKKGPFDLWKLRDQFLSWPIEDWQGFIAMAGWLHPMPVSARDFERCQRFVREALIRPAREWKALEEEFGGEDRLLHLSHSLSSIRFQWSGEVPTAQIQTLWSLDAILATIQIDKLQGAEFRVCARHDCKNAPFRVEARHKIFCDAACAHLVAVRKSRERAANAKATKKAPNRKLSGGKTK